MNHDNDNLADDVLKGAAEIADFLGEDRRSVFYMISKNRLPHYRLGESIRARKSTLRAWVAEQEGKAA
jgi:excisionase family DNA binding protein